MRVLDLFCGRFGWGRAFAARGHEVVGIDLVEPPEVPAGCTFIKADILQLHSEGNGRFTIWEFDTHGQILWDEQFDFVCASSPCEKFSKHGLRCFFPNPPYPDLGIQLFNHTQSLCEASGLPYVMENVRAAQDFVGNAVNHCGPFYLWGNAVPPIMPQGIIKGMTRLALGYRHLKGKPGWNTKNEASENRLREDKAASMAATIPPELANCVCDYAERITEQVIA
jgi:hypothetical protein